MTHITSRLTAKTGISSGTVGSVIEYGYDSNGYLYLLGFRMTYSEA